MLALVALVGATLVPAYLRALDVDVVQATGSKGPSLVQEAVGLIEKEEIGQAELFMLAARELKVPEHEKLAEVLQAFKKQHRDLARAGVAASYLDPLFGAQSGEGA
ncbi:MAG: hypothetical protein KDM81_06355, partial [Verrucomicrobiae bacterium]|nr:hypothetical protein [Verrucomicrobiae bacterium]